MLLKESFTHEHITALVLLARSYINIKNGFEPPTSTYVPDRMASIKLMADMLINEIEASILDIKEYIILSKNNNEESLKIPVYDVRPDSSLEKRMLPINQAAKLWIIHLH